MPACSFKESSKLKVSTLNIYVDNTNSVSQDLTPFIQETEPSSPSLLSDDQALIWS